MEDKHKIKNIIEALLIVSEEGLSREDLKNSIKGTDLKDIEEGVVLLKEDYKNTDRAFNVSEIAGRYRIVTKPDYLPWISTLYQKEIDRLSGPSLETLAILAYKQPATRAEVENIRGVNVGGMLKALLDKNLIRIKGRRDVIGRPLVYETTEKFLEIFGLNSLDDLPALKDFGEDDIKYGKTNEADIIEINSEDDLEETKDLHQEAGNEPAIDDDPGETPDEDKEKEVAPGETGAVIEKTEGEEDL